MYFGYENIQVAFGHVPFAAPIVRAADTTTVVVGRTFVLPPGASTFVPAPGRNDAPSDGVRFVLREEGGTASEYFDVRGVGGPIGAPLTVDAILATLQGSYTVTGSVGAQEALFACCVFEHMLVAPRELVAEGTINGQPFVYRDTASQSLIDNFHAYGSGNEYTSRIDQPGEQGRITVTREAFRQRGAPVTGGERMYVRIAMPYDRDSAVFNYGGSPLFTIDIGSDRVFSLSNAIVPPGVDTLTRNVFLSLNTHLFRFWHPIRQLEGAPKHFEVLLAPALFAMRWRVRTATGPPTNPTLPVVAALESAGQALRAVADSFQPDPVLGGVALQMVRTADTMSVIAGRTFARLGTDSVFSPIDGDGAPAPGARFMLNASAYADLDNVVADQGDTIYVNVQSPTMNVTYSIIGTVVDTATAGGVEVHRCCRSGGLLAAPRSIEASGTVRSLAFTVIDSSYQDAQTLFRRHRMNVETPTGLVMLFDSVNGPAATLDGLRRVGVAVPRTGQPPLYVDVQATPTSFNLDLSQVVVGVDTLRVDPYGLWSGGGHSVPRRIVEDYLAQAQRVFVVLRSHRPAETMLAPALFAMRWRTRHM